MVKVGTLVLFLMGRGRASPLRIRPGCRADWKMHLGAILPSEEEGKAQPGGLLFLSLHKGAVYGLPLDYLVILSQITAPTWVYGGQKG